VFGSNDGCILLELNASNMMAISETINRYFLLRLAIMVIGV